MIVYAAYERDYEYDDREETSTPVDRLLRLFASEEAAQSFVLERKGVTSSYNTLRADVIALCDRIVGDWVAKLPVFSNKGVIPIAEMRAELQRRESYASVRRLAQSFRESLAWRVESTGDLKTAFGNTIEHACLGVKDLPPAPDFPSTITKPDSYGYDYHYVPMEVIE